MHTLLGRYAVSRLVRARIARRVALTLLGFLITACAQAVVIRGRLTDALGKAVPGGMVRLVEGGKSVAFAYAEADGSFEIRAADSGRFTLLGSAAGFLPAIGVDFYGGATDVLQQDVVLAANTVRQDITVSATGIPTPLPQLTSPVTVIPAEASELQPGIVDALRQTPGAFLVQTGQLGGVTSLFMRGGSSTANLVTIDGVPADDVGGVFDFGTVSSAAIGKIDVVRGPDSAMYGTDAGAGVINIETPRGTTLEPQLNYEGDAGNLHTYRNQVSLGGTLRRLDYFGAYSRINTSNAVPLDEYHSSTSAANVGYDFNGNTQMRFTIRNADSVEGVPGAYDFQGLSQNNRQADQDLYSGLTLENRYKSKWHNLARYGIARKREQEQQFAAGGTYLADDPGEFDGPGNVGNAVTIRGANGYRAKGQVQLFSGNNYDQDSNRDQLYYQTDYSFSPHLIGLFGFRYDKERGSFNDYDPGFDYTLHERTQRTNFEYNLQFQGEFWNRLFYSAGGAVEKNHLYGIAGTPRLGLAYVPVRPSAKRFHGTRFRANAATGVQEPTLAIEFGSLYTQLLAAGDTADIAQYRVTPQSAERSRTYDVGVDQNILGERLTMKVGYFHNVFDHQLEGVGAEALDQYFNLNIQPGVGLYEAYLNSLAYSAQGGEVEVAWQPRPHFLFRGGYTYLDARVLRSFSSDAVAANQGTPTENPNLPGIGIGALGPLVGARPFRRAPNTGYFQAQYTRPRTTFSLTGAMASRSDDSTLLEGEDLNGGNTLLLPNRNLDFGYVKLDLAVTYALKHGFTYFAQIDNLLNDQHIGPLGYPGLPLTFRTGLKLQLGGK
ncbi:MAG: TonB-dependent receptor [Acidobacteriota bacterium]|nr:TonB-dependent receptor [Acidobacteriota bacterium]